MAHYSLHVLHNDSLCRSVKIRGEKIGNSELAVVSIQFDKYLLPMICVCYDPCLITRLEQEEV